MRNLLQYPITNEEVVRYLMGLRDAISLEQRIGGTGPLLLQYAIDVIEQASKVEKEK